MKQYENVFTTGEWGSDLWVRLFDTETKESSYKKIPNNQYVPFIYTLDKPTPNAISENPANEKCTKNKRINYNRKRFILKHKRRCI